MWKLQPREVEWHSWGHTAKSSRVGIHTGVFCPQSQCSDLYMYCLFCAAAVAISTPLWISWAPSCRGTSILHRGKLGLSSLLLVFDFQLIQCTFFLSLLFVGKSYYDFKDYPRSNWDLLHPNGWPIFMSYSHFLSLLPLGNRIISNPSSI